MSTSQTRHYRTFVLCCGEIAQGELVVNPNVNLSEHNQMLYALSGSGVCACGEALKELPALTLTDLSEFKGKEVVYSSSSPTSSWVAFNPRVPNTHLDVTILKEPLEGLLHDPALETYIVPLKGSVQINDKTIEEYKCGRLLVGKEGLLRVPEGTTCAIVKVIKETNGEAPK